MKSHRSEKARLCFYANPIDKESSTHGDNATSVIRREGESGKQRTPTEPLMKAIAIVGGDKYQV